MNEKKTEDKRNGVPFTDDKEKMIDFRTLSKEEFLKTYPYLSDADYEATRIEAASFT